MKNMKSFGLFIAEAWQPAKRQIFFLTLPWETIFVFSHILIHELEIFKLGKVAKAA